MVTRLPDQPEITTLAKVGYLRVSLSRWSLTLRPASTREPIVNKLAADITRILHLLDKRSASLRRLKTSA